MIGAARVASRSFAGIYVCAALSGCAGILGLEDQVPYVEAQWSVFPTCRSATGAIFCREDWSPNEFPAAQGCVADIVPVQGGTALRVGAPGKRDGEKACVAIPLGNSGGRGLRARFRYRLEDAPRSPQDTVSLTAFISGQSEILVSGGGELEGDVIIDNGSNMPAQAEFTPTLNGWHEVQYVAEVGGKVSVFADGKFLVEGSPFLVNGGLEFDIISFSTGKSSVIIDDLIVLPF